MDTVGDNQDLSKFTIQNVGFKFFRVIKIKKNTDGLYLINLLVDYWCIVGLFPE